MEPLFFCETETFVCLTIPITPNRSNWVSGTAFFNFVRKGFFLAVLDLRFCAWAFSSCGEPGLLSPYGAPAFPCRGFSVVLVHRVSHLTACGTFPDRDRTRVTCIGRRTLIHYVVFCCAQSLPLCPTLCNPMDCSPPGSPVHGIVQARIQEWVAMPSSKESSQLKGGTRVSCISCIAGKFFTMKHPGKRPHPVYHQRNPRNLPLSSRAGW